MGPALVAAEAGAAAAVGVVDASGGFGRGRFTPAVFPVLALRASSRALILACNANALALLSIEAVESSDVAAVPDDGTDGSCCCGGGAVAADASPHLLFLRCLLSSLAASLSLLDDILSHKMGVGLLQLLKNFGFLILYSIFSISLQPSSMINDQ